MKTSQVKTSASKRPKMIMIMVMFVLAITIPSGVNGSHIIGGEITYQWAGNNDYLVRVTLYRDCSGISSPLLAQIGVSSTTCSYSGTETLPQVGSTTIITPICATSLPQSSCNSGMLFSIQKNVYEGLVTLPSTCNDWTFSYDICCQSSNLTNIVNAGNYGMYLSATLNNLDFPFNNSIQFNSDPVHIIYNNVTTSVNNSGFDSDGDSVIYEMTPSLDLISGTVIPLVYASGYTFDQPVASFSPTVLDANGVLSISPNMTQISLMRIKVSEYRQGIMISETSREFPMTVVNSTNNLPELTGMNGTNNFITNGCPGDTITFDVISSDPDPSQNLSVYMDPNGTNATLNTTVGQYPVGEFTWSPVTGDISSQPYVFNISVADDHCDYYGVQSYSYYVYVNGCNTFDVWPGDANSDGTANMYDLLALGLAYNDIGPVRPSANLTWTGQPCSNWNNWFVSGINHKHADTDGNGVVNIDDTTAIMLNYGLNHPLRVSQNNGLAIADLSVTANYDTVGTSTAVTFDVAFASSVDSIYGLAFRLLFDTSLVDIGTVSVTYPGSVFGTNGVDMLKIDKTHVSSGYVDIALSRIDQLNISGMGPVARITIVTTDNVSGKLTLVVEPTDIAANTATGYDVTLNSIGDEVVIDPNFLSINESVLTQHLIIHPVPTSNVLHVQYKGLELVNSIKLYDASGKEIMLDIKPSHKNAIDIGQLSEGVYYMKVIIDNTTIIKKIVKI